MRANASILAGEGPKASRDSDIKMLSKTINFLKEVKVELKKVSWPDRNELVGSTVVIIITVAMVAVFIGVCDFVFSKLIHIIIR